MRHRMTAMFVALLMMVGLFVTTPAASAIVTPTAIQQLPYTWNGPKAGSFVKAECALGRVSLYGRGLGTGMYGTAQKGGSFRWMSLQGGTFAWSGVATTHYTLVLQTKNWTGVAEWRLEISNCAVTRITNKWTSTDLIQAVVSVSCAQGADGLLKVDITGGGHGRGNLTINQLGVRMGGSHDLDGSPFAISNVVTRDATIQLTLTASRWNNGQSWTNLLRGCEPVRGRAFTEGNPEDYSVVTIVCASAGNGHRTVEFAGEYVGNGSFGYLNPNGSSGSGPVNSDRNGSFKMEGRYPDQSSVANWLQTDGWHSSQRTTFTVMLPSCAVATS